MKGPAPLRRWRPSLGLIIFSVLAVVAVLPLIALGVFRLFDNELVRQTERELIAQSAVFSAIVTLELEAATEPIAGFGVPPGRIDPKQRFRPVRPILDFTRHVLLPPRPDAQPPETALRVTYREIGLRVTEIAHRTQSVTLADFRILDPAGRVFAGGGEIGMSLAHVNEVRTAMSGTYSSVVRRRSSVSRRPVRGILEPYCAFQGFHCNAGSGRRAGRGCGVCVANAAEPDQIRL